jgi:hypothetical protein
MRPIETLKRMWATRWGRRAIIMLGLVLLLSAPLRCDGPYKGRVVEEKTGQPIPGVLAVANWTGVSVNIAGGTTYCIDAAEALTDENGEFEIPGRRASLFRNLGTMNISIYKVGYQKVECMWKEFYHGGSCYDEPVAFEGDRAIFPLRLVPKAKLNTELASPPHISCGRKDGKALVEYFRIREEYFQAVRKAKD